MDTETMLTDQMQMHSLTILTNGRILMGMGMEIMETGHLAMELNGPMMTVTDMETIQTELMATSSLTTHYAGPIEMLTGTVTNREMTTSH